MSQFVLPPLPYAYDALEPTVSDATLHVHHDKHHKAYVDTLNKLIGEWGETYDSLEAVIRAAAGDAGKKKLFNNAAQAWNHAFFWDCMTPNFAAPSGALKSAIDEAFGSQADLKAKFVEEGVGHFASGWVWLAAEGGQLKVLSTHDAEDLVTREGLTPLLVCDLWEHAYYLDYKNDRKGFLEKWFDTVANFELAASQFSAALGQGTAWRYPSPGETSENQTTGRPAAGGPARPGDARPLHS